MLVILIFLITLGVGSILGYLRELSKQNQKMIELLEKIHSDQNEREL
ncbi:hypothetical protein [Sutcliffiella deserti]|nr:hypothetical protein [Sutcliffiella deserti]